MQSFALQSLGNYQYVKYNARNICLYKLLKMYLFENIQALQRIISMLFKVI